MLPKFHEFRAYNLKLLDRIGEAGLDARPLNVPQGFEGVMTSVGKTFLLLRFTTWSTTARSVTSGASWA